MAGDIASNLLDQAKAHLSAGDYDKAVKAAKGVIALDSGNSEASDILAASLAAGGGEPDKAPQPPVAVPAQTPTVQSTKKAPEVDIYEGNASVMDVLASYGLFSKLALALVFIGGLVALSFTGWFLFMAIVYILVQLSLAKLSSNNFHVKITSERVTITTGIFSKNFETIELYRGKDTGVRQGILQSMVGSGTMSLVSDDETAPAVWFIVHSPREIQEKVRKAIREQRLAMGTTARI